MSRPSTSMSVVMPEEEEVDPVTEARREVEHDLASISSDNFDAPFRDSIVLCSHILDTHKVGLQAVMF